MSTPLPDRLSVNPNSPYYNEDILKQNVRILFNGVEKFNVEEYCLSEKWVRVTIGKTLDRKGRPLTMKLTGDIVAFIDNKTP